MAQTQGTNTQTKHDPFNPGETDSILGFMTSRDIISNLKQYSLARTHRFIVTFTLPSFLRDYVNKRDSSLLNRETSIKINCTQVSTPQKNFNLSGLGNAAHEGRIATSANLNEISMSFVCATDLKEKVLFEYWMDFIYSPKDRFVRFFDDYCTDFTIFQLDPKNKPTYGIKVAKAYPIQVASHQYDMQLGSSPVRVDTIIAYTYYETFDYNEAPAVPPIP